MPAAVPRPDALLDALPDLVAVIADDGAVTYVNAGGERMLGWSRADWLGRSALDLVHPDDIDLAVLALTSVAAKDVGLPLVVRLATGEGGYRHVEIVGAGRSDDPELGGVVLAGRDVTERRRLEVGADDAELFRALVQASPAITALVGPDGTVRTINHAVARVLGIDPEYAVGVPLWSWVDPGHAERLRHDVERALATPGRTSAETQVRHGTTGRTVAVEFQFVNLLDDPVVGGLAVTGVDITELAHARRDRETLASYERVTGLANGMALRQRLAAWLSTGRAVSLLGCDLDHLSQVNATHGLHVGDQVLRAAAERLVALVPGALAASLGGDDLVLALVDLDDEQAAWDLARRVEAELSRPYQLAAAGQDGHGVVVELGATAGAATAPRGTRPDDLMADLDAAVRGRKSERRGRAGSAPRRGGERRRMAAELAEGIVRGEIEGYVQPVVRTIDDRVCGVEALARWRHPRLGILAPGAFLDVAEMVGLDADVGLAVLASAARQVRGWRDEGLVDDTFCLSVNLSASQLARHDLPERVIAEAARAGLAPEMLCFEISERTMFDAPGGTVEDVLARLRAAGARIAVDDFGTGYSSLAHLRRFEVDVLKIDRTFVGGLGRSRGDTSIVKALVDLSHALGLGVVAEGVERPDQRRLLRAFGVDRLQGFLISPPVPADEFAARLRLGAPGYSPARATGQDRARREEVA